MSARAVGRAIKFTLRDTKNDFVKTKTAVKRGIAAWRLKKLRPKVNQAAARERYWKGLSASRNAERVQMWADRKRIDAIPADKRSSADRARLSEIWDAFDTIGRHGFGTEMGVMEAVKKSTNRTKNLRKVAKGIAARAKL